jgi:hypothetical protein
VLTASAITSGTGAAGASTGTTATFYRLFKSDGTTACVDGTVGRRAAISTSTIRTSRRPERRGQRVHDHRRQLGWPASPSTFTRRSTRWSAPTNPCHPRGHLQGADPDARYNLGTQFFNKVGRKLRIRAFGKITTAATPGNGQVGILFGTNADANGVNVCQSAAFALIASQTNLSWNCEIYISARSLGATGTLMGTGWIEFNPGVVASTAQPLMIPASAAVVSAHAI